MPLMSDGDTDSMPADPDGGSSVCGSEVGNDEAGEPGGLCAQEWFNLQTFVHVRTCVTCSHKSNERNPITHLKSPWASTFKLPAWPWLHGSQRGMVVDACGQFCRICEWVRVLGAFSHKYKDLNAVKEQQNKEQCFTQEWIASQTKLIELINNGKVGARLKGRTRANITDIIVEQRKTVVDAYQREGMKVKDPHRAVLVSV